MWLAISSYLGIRILFRALHGQIKSGCPSNIHMIAKWTELQRHDVNHR